MIKSQLFHEAHTEARKIVAQKRCSYAEAFKFGLRRVYNKIETEAFVAAEIAKQEMPKFMWLRGM